MSTRADHEFKTLELLSPREREVLELIAKGMTNAQTAAHLHITTHAVKYHLASIYRKLTVVNRTEAAACFWEQEHAPRSPTPEVVA